MTTNVLTATERREVIKRARAGESLAELAREFGVTRQAIGYHTRRVLGPRDVRKVSEEMVMEMRAAWDKGATAQEIGKQFGVAERTVADYMKRSTARSGRLKRVPQFLPPEDPADTAYLAAMLDAEGCIYRGGSPSVHWRVSITGSSPDLMEWLCQWGGSVYKPRRQKRSGSRQGFRKQVYVWSLQTMWDIATMLDTTLPFMIEKQGRAASTVEEILGRHGSPPWAPEVRPIRT